MSEKTLGQIAFEKYNEAKGGLTYDGKPIPPWESLAESDAGLAVQSAWEVAARAAADEMVARWPASLFGEKALEAAAREGALAMKAAVIREWQSFGVHRATDITDVARIDAGPLAARVIGREVSL